MAIDLEDSWRQELEEELESKRMRELSQWLREQLRGKNKVYPPPKLIFNALNSTPLPTVKAVIIGLMLRNQCPLGESVRLSFCG